MKQLKRQLKLVAEELDRYGATFHLHEPLPPTLHTPLCARRRLQSENNSKAHQTFAKEMHSMQQLFDECSTLKREADTTFAAVCTMYGALCVVIDVFVTLIITTSL